MKINHSLDDFRVPTHGKPFRISKAKTSVKKAYHDKADYRKKIEEFQEEIHELQQMMYAQDRHALLLVFQAMDAAGKDSTIQHVMSGVNPQGVVVHSFKKPTERELDHDFLWRCSRVAPERGRIGIFNRSYYEEVLVCRVHPEIIINSQRLPENRTKDMKKLIQGRLQDIKNYEAYLHANGTKVVKFFLHVSKDEQKNRFMDRIDTPAKNWKFNEADVEERAYWDDYMEAYQDTLRTTATPDSPWYVIPADDKKTMRLMVGAAILHEMQQLHLAFPTLPDNQLTTLNRCRKLLFNEGTSPTPKRP